MTGRDERRSAAIAATLAEIAHAHEDERGDVVAGDHGESDAGRGRAPLPSSERPQLADLDVVHPLRRHELLERLAHR